MNQIRGGGGNEEGRKEEKLKEKKQNKKKLFFWRRDTKKYKKSKPTKTKRINKVENQPNVAWRWLKRISVRDLKAASESL